MFRQRLLLSPGERQAAEYKASIPFDGQSEFSLKLARNIQGMANADGGWFVIGYSEDTSGLLVPDPAHSDAVCQSYDPTDLAKQLNSFVHRGQQLHVTVYFEQHPNNGRRYPVISVQGFDRSPYVCRSSRNASDTGALVLEQGAVYLRRPGAETSKVSTPEDWEDLITSGVRKRRDEFLVEFRELFERMTFPQAPSAAGTGQLEAWAMEMRSRAFG